MAHGALVPGAESTASEIRLSETADLGSADSDLAYDSGSGSYLAVWSASEETDPSFNATDEVVARLLDADGRPAGPEHVLATNVQTVQPRVTFNVRSHEFLVAWGAETSSGPGNVSVVRVGPDGVPAEAPHRISNDEPNSPLGGYGITPSVASSAVSGDYLVTWMGRDGVSGQWLSPSGAELGGDLVIGPSGDFPDVAYNWSRDEFLVTWQKDSTPSMSDIFATRISGPGATPSGPLPVSETGDCCNHSGAEHPSVAYDAALDEYVVAWIAGKGMWTSAKEVYGQRLDATGAEVGRDDFRISDDRFDASSGAGLFDGPALAAAPDGSLAVAWRDPESHSGGERARLYGQMLNAAAPDSPAPDTRIADTRPVGFGDAWIEIPALAAGDGRFMALFPEEGWDGGEDPTGMSRRLVSLPLGDSDATPDTTITNGPPALSPSRDASVEFEGNGDAAGFDCRLDATRWEPCESPWHGEVSDARHILEVRGRDSRGWVDTTPALYRWVVESGPPDTTITRAPAPISKSRHDWFGFHSSEYARFQCRFDRTQWQPCGESGSYSLTGNSSTDAADGPHRFEVRAVDVTGAIDPTPASGEWTVDTQGATVAITRAPQGRVNRDTATVSFDSPDKEAGFECAINGGQWATCASPLQLSDLSDGLNYLRIRARDAAGNDGLNEVYTSWTVDTQPPGTQIYEAPPSVWAGVATFKAGGVGGVTYECRLDAAAWAPCEMDGIWVRQQYDALAPGDHTFEVRASDDLGNTDPTPASATWRVAAQNPHTTITERPSQATASSDARFAWTSDTAGATFECRLDNAGWDNCESPYEIHEVSEGDHSFFVRATGSDGSVEPYGARAEWIVDQREPDTQIVSGPQPVTEQTSATLWFSSWSIATPQTECRLDGGAWYWCSGSQTVSGLSDGPHRFEVHGVGWVGNHESTPAKWEWTVQTGAPQTTITTASPGRQYATTAPSASFAFTSNESDVTYECRLDSASFTACSSPMEYSGLADGRHQIQVRAVDSSGLADLSPALYDWYVDATPPETGATVFKTGPTARRAEISRSEDTALLQCRLDAEEWHQCASSVYYDGLADGAHAFEARATDRYGNADPTPARYTFEVDTVAPDTTIAVGPSSREHTADAAFEFRSSEEGESFQCQLDHETFRSCTSQSTFRQLPDGDHTLSVKAVDADGNVDATPATWAWTVAADPTYTEFSRGPAEESTVNYARFEWVTVSGAGFECRLDGSEWAPCTSPQELAGLSEGDHVFEVLGHRAEGERDAKPQSYAWHIDTLNPNTSITSRPSLFETTGDAHFTMSATKSDATFECAIDGAPWAPCPADYNVTGLADGRHVMQARAVSNGHADPTPELASWNVDTVAPDTVVDSNVGGGLRTSRTEAEFTFVATGIQPDYGHSFICRIDGSAWGKCYSTLTGLADGPHSITVAARDQAGNVDPTPETVSWTVDTGPADTSVDSAPTGVEPEREGSVSFSSPTANAGFECRIDDGPWDACESPHLFSGLADGTHTAEVRAEVRGNFDPTPAVATWRVDAAPDTTIATHPDRLSSASAFGFSSDESGTFECKLDLAPTWTPCTSTQRFDLPDGQHHLAVRAVDATARVDPSPAEWTWTLDATAPHTTFTSAPSGRRPTTHESFDFHADEDGVVFDCRQDAGTWVPCEPPHSAGSFANGSHTMDVRATDRAGNVESDPPRAQWNVDTSPADTRITSRPFSPTKSTGAELRFESTAGATFECRLDGAGWSSCSSPQVYTQLTDGAHTFRVRATDTRGRVDQTPAEYQWAVDTRPPRVEILGGPAQLTEDTDAYFGIVSDDYTRSFECRVDSGAWSWCAGPVALHNLADGWHTLEARAYDSAANVAETERQWRVSRQPPETMFYSRPPDRTDSRHAELSFWSDDFRAGFDCSMDGADWAPCESPVSYDGLAVGEHLFRVRAIDSLGRIDPTPAEATWVVVEPAPTSGGDPPAGDGPPVGDDPPAGGDPPAGDDPPVGGDPPAGDGPPPGGDPPAGDGPAAVGDPPAGDPPAGADPPSGAQPPVGDPPTDLPSTGATSHDPPDGAPAPPTDQPQQAQANGPLDLSAPVSPEIPRIDDPVGGFLARLLAGHATAFTHRGLGSLLRNRRLSVPTAGTLTERLYIGHPTERRRAGPAGRALMLASAKRTFAHAGAARLSLRLTKLGRRALELRRLTVTFVYGFQRSGDGAASARAVTATAARRKRSR